MARKTKKHRAISIISGLLILSGFTILLVTFLPLGREEVKYAMRNPKEDIKPVDTDFGIVIPKIGANAHVIANVDPFDSRAYQMALTRGVAHARGTAVPGAKGNIFLFAHSSENFYDAMHYNAIFYLINKLENNDDIILYFHDTAYTYRVTEKKFVDPKEVRYLQGESLQATLTLMTCWPPGTNLKRLLIFAQMNK